MDAAPMIFNHKCSYKKTFLCLQKDETIEFNHGLTEYCLYRVHQQLKDVWLCGFTPPTGERERGRESEKE